MMIFRSIAYFLTVLIFSIELNAQDLSLDSLKNALRNAKHDTSRCNILNEMVNAENDDNIWPIYNDQLLKLCEKNLKDVSQRESRTFYLKHLARTFNNIGSLSLQQGDISKALAHHQKSLAIRNSIKDKEGMAYSYNNLGIIYYNQGDIPKALEYYHKSLKIQEEISDKKGMALSLNNIGFIYRTQGDVTKALEQYQKSLIIQGEINDNYGIARSLNNIGDIYQNEGNNIKALEYYQMSLKIREKINDKNGIALSFINIGDVYKNQGSFSNALDYYHKSLKIQEEIQDKKVITRAQNNIALAMVKKGQVQEAIPFAVLSLKTAKELGFPMEIKNAATTLKDIYKQKKNYKEAIEMYELQVQMRDSINNVETKKASIKKQFQYQYEKKAAADSVKNAAEEKVKNAQLNAQRAQLKQERTQRFALYGGLALVLVFAGFILRSLRLTKSQKKVIEIKNRETEYQKHIIEEKNKDITDSINYAKRLQEAILPSERSVMENLKESFILYKPKDIIAGDFYWMEKKDELVFIAAADCTGHGVPGAMISVVCSNALNRAVKEFGLKDPGRILDKVRELVIETFEKSESEVKDGMDISLCAINNITQEISWSGANNPLWYYSENELKEVKPDKQPVGKHALSTPFTTHRLQLNKGETVYLFTDGYADQFGGEKGKKFKYSKLKDLLTSISSLSMSEQKKRLDEAFEAWRGKLEQVDDVCLIGVRV